MASNFSSWSDGTQYGHHMGYGTRPKFMAPCRVTVDGVVHDLVVLYATTNLIVATQPGHDGRRWQFRARKDGSWRLVGRKETLEIL